MTFLTDPFISHLKRTAMQFLIIAVLFVYCHGFSIGYHGRNYSDFSGIRTKKAC